MKTSKWFQIIICGRVQPPLPIPKTSPPPHLLNFVECPFFVDFFLAKEVAVAVLFNIPTQRNLSRSSKNNCVLNEKQKKYQQYQHFDNIIQH